MFKFRFHIANENLIKRFFGKRRNLWNFIAGILVIKLGCFRLERFFAVQHKRQHVVFYIDQIQRFIRNFDAAGCDKCHAVAGKAHMSIQHTAVIRQAAFPIRRIFVGGYADHAFQRFGAADVDPADDTVRIRRAQHTHDQHVRDIQIIQILLPPGHNIRRVSTSSVFANIAILMLADLDFFFHLVIHPCIPPRSFAE